MRETDETTQRMTPAEFRDKLEWEGGIGALIEYGVLADEVPEELASLWREARLLHRDFLYASEQIEKVIYRD